MTPDPTHPDAHPDAAALAAEVTRLVEELVEHEVESELAAVTSCKRSDIQQSVILRVRLTDTIRRLAALAQRPEQWISVDDPRRPKPREVILVAVAWMRRGEDDEGRLFETSGVDVTEGEWVGPSEHGAGYFASFQGEHGDSYGVTHWMPMPAAPGAQRPESTSERSAIERDESMNRDFIPLPGGWEMQTKGVGSTLRLLDTKIGERHPLPLPDHVVAFIERMAREVHAASTSERAQGADVPDIIAGALQTSRAHAYELMEESLAARAQGAEVDLRGIDAGTLDDWNNLRSHGKVLANDQLVLVADLPTIIARAHHAVQVEKAVRRDATCEWWQDDADWETGAWSSSCGGGPWLFEAEDPTKNGMRFCIHCGRRMVQRDAARAQLGGKGGGDADADA
jgi:hypothetical protein